MEYILTSIFNIIRTIFSIYYIILAWLIGFFIIKNYLPFFYNLTSSTTSLFNKKINVKRWVIIFPASFLIGLLVAAVSTYYLSFIFSFTNTPLLYGNFLYFFIFTIIIYKNFFKNKNPILIFIRQNNKKDKLISFIKNNKFELIFIIINSIFWSYFMIRSFYIMDNKMYIGLSVFSDFAPHLSIIRSFSKGLNFPTEYPHFSNGHIRYHFFSQFLAGNLEYIGLRIDWAFNLISIISIVSFVMLLFSFAIILFDEKSVGILAVLFFSFRSSFAFFSYLIKFDKFSLFFKDLIKNTTLIGNTINENWGLYTQKVYLNQRHLALSLGILVIVLIILYPLLKKMLDDLKSLSRYKGNFIKHFIKSMQKFLFIKNAWLPESIARPVFIGILVGIMSFWNGAVVITILLITFMLALFSKNRLEYLILALIIFLFTFLQTKFFIGFSETSFTPAYFFGFNARIKTLLGVIIFYVELLGILLFLIIPLLFVNIKWESIKRLSFSRKILLVFSKLFQLNGIRIYFLAFIILMVFATTIKITPDINVNHKYIIISVILLNILVAGFINYLFKNKELILKSLAILFVILLTITGVVDLITVYNIDKNSIVHKIDNSLMLWIEKNTKPDEKFLTDYYSIHSILLAGRKIFHGWPYYSWGAGYNTQIRDEISKKIFEGKDIIEIKKLLLKYNLVYVVFDDGIRISKRFNANEGFFKNNFKQVYKYSVDNLVIYKTTAK